MKIDKLSRNALRLLGLFLNHKNGEFYALELAKLMKITYGSIIPLLAKFEKAGWLETDWENIDPVAKGRPKRKYYKLTGKGQMVAKQVVEQEIEFLRGVVPDEAFS